MDITFEEWIIALKVLIELGDKHGFNVYDDEYFNNPIGCYRVIKELHKSDRLDNNVYIGWEDRI